MYAFGEVILVVVGILIALSVNNWNSERLEAKKLERFIHNLKLQLDKNLSNTEYYIEDNTYYYKKSREFLSIIGSQEKAVYEHYLDSLILFNSLDFHLNLDLSTIMEASDNGDFALIESDSLRKSIYYLVSFNKEIIERERITNFSTNNDIGPYLNKNYNIRNLIDLGFPEENFGKSKIYKNDNHKILMDQEFENLLIKRVLNTLELLEMYVELKEVLLGIYKML